MHRHRALPVCAAFLLLWTSAGLASAQATAKPASQDEPRPRAQVKHTPISSHQFHSNGRGSRSGGDDILIGGTTSYEDTPAKSPKKD